MCESFDAPFRYNGGIFDEFCNVSITEMHQGGNKNLDELLWKALRELDNKHFTKGVGVRGGGGKSGNFDHQLLSTQHDCDSSKY